MSLEIVRSWFNALPDSEKDLPLLILDGKAYSPRLVLNEVLRRTDLGSRLQSLIEGKRIGTKPEEEQSLAKIRLRMWLKTLPEKPLVATLGLPERTFTPSQLLEEIERGTPAGKAWISAETAQMRRLVEVR